MAINTDPNKPSIVLRVLIGCSAIYAVGNIIGFLVPQVLFGVMHQHGVSAAEAGLLTLIEGLVGGALSILLGAKPPALSNRSLALMGGLLYVATNIASSFIPNFHWLLLIRLFSGISNAVLICVAVSLVANMSRNPDRGYATMNIVANLLGALILAGVPTIAPQAAGLSYLMYGGFIAAVLLPLVFLLPNSKAADMAHAAEHATAAVSLSRQSQRNAGTFSLLMLLMAALSIQSFAMFSFSPGLGAAIGMSEADIGKALGAATLVSIIGPFIAGYSSQRIGRWWTVVVISVFFLSANVLITQTHDQAIFTACMLVNLVAAYCYLPLLQGWCAALDASGRYGNIMTGGFMIITSITPSTIGFAVDHAGLSALFFMVISTGTAAGLLLLILRYSNRRIQTNALAV